MKSLLSFNGIFILIISYSACYGQKTLSKSTSKPALEEMVSQSDLVIEGSVIDIKGFQDKEKIHIYSSAIIRISKLFKGNSKDSVIEIDYDGGESGDLVVVSSHGLHLNTETTGIFFLQNNTIRPSLNKDIKSYIVLLGNYGCLRYNTDPYFPRAKFNGVNYNDFENDLYPAIEKAIKTPKKVLSKNIFGQ